MSEELKDARGVEISPGDTVIYGFGVGQSIAMAEGVVQGEGEDVSLTPSGRIRIRVIRRSFSQGEKPVVDVQADRLVVLKGGAFRPYLPESPLPTQDDEAREYLTGVIAMYETDLEAGKAPYWWKSTPGDWQEYRRKRLAALRRKLEALDG